MEITHLNEVIPGLYLGSVEAISEKTYQTFHIRKVISIMGSKNELEEVSRWLEGSQVEHTCVLVRDNGRDPIEGYFEPLTNEIKSALERKVPTLVHCFAGVSRSATLVAAFLSSTQGWDYNQALEFLKTKRSVVDPCFGFVAKLAARFPKVC